jgi:PAS domain S-box-containing protein
VPLRSQGGALIGVVCVLGQEPRLPDGRAASALSAAARAVEGYVATQEALALLRGRHDARADELARLRGLVGATAMLPTVTTDLEGTIQGLNASAERCFRVRAEEIVRRTSLTAFAGERPDLSIAELLGPKPDGEGEARSWIYRRRDGTAFMASVTASPMHDDEGTKLGYVFVIQDVTDRRRAEETMRRSHEELAAVNRELARSARLKDVFITGMSRELRSPLNAILGLAEALEEKVYGALSDEQRRAVEGIRQSGRQLLTLSNDVLDLFKAEAGRLELDIRPVSVAAACRACLQAVQEEAHKKHLAISLRLDEDLGAVDADERRLAQVLVNLCRGAIETASEGGAMGLTVAADTTADAVRFTVWDTGVGVSPETLAQFFEAFGEPGGAASGGRTRAGVALALARRLIELHHGDIALESEAGTGTRLTVMLPRKYERHSASPGSSGRR